MQKVEVISAVVYFQGKQTSKKNNKKKKNTKEKNQETKPQKPPSLVEGSFLITLKQIIVPYLNSTTSFFPFVIYLLVFLQDIK